LFLGARRSLAAVARSGVIVRSALARRRRCWPRRWRIAEKTDNRFIDFCEFDRHTGNTATVAAKQRRRAASAERTNYPRARTAASDRRAA